MPISEQATLTAADLYIAKRDDLLFDLACENRTAHDALDAFDATWRESHASDEKFRVIEGSDGLPMITERPD